MASAARIGGGVALNFAPPGVRFAVEKAMDLRNAIQGQGESQQNAPRPAIVFTPNPVVPTPAALLPPPGYEEEQSDEPARL